MELKLKILLIGSLSLLEGKLNVLLKTLIGLIWKYRGWLMKMIIWWIRFNLRKIPYSISRNRLNSIWIMRTKISKKLSLIKVKFLNKKKKQMGWYHNCKMKFKILKYKNNNYKITMLNNAANSKSKSYHWKTSMNNYNNSTSRKFWTNYI